MTQPFLFNNRRRAVCRLLVTIRQIVRYRQGMKITGGRILPGINKVRVCQVKCVSFFIVSILTSYFKGGIGQSELPLLLWEISRRSGF